MTVKYRSVLREKMVTVREVKSTDKKLINDIVTIEDSIIRKM